VAQPRSPSAGQSRTERDGLRTRGQWSAVKRAKAPERVSSILDGTGALRRRTPQSGSAFLRASSRALGRRGQDIETVLRASGSILDALNPVRNNASVAHPNEDLLGREEAELVINVGRSLLSYLDAKLGT
jgi:hypothetical protein